MSDADVQLIVHPPPRHNIQPKSRSAKLLLDVLRPEYIFSYDRVPNFFGTLIYNLTILLINPYLESCSTLLSTDYFFLYVKNSACLDILPGSTEHHVMLMREKRSLICVPHRSVSMNATRVEGDAQIHIGIRV